MATSYYLDGQTLYIGTTGGQVLQMGGASDNGAAINWSIDYKPLSEGDETVRKTINRLWVVADIDPGSSLNVAYAAGTEGGVWNVVSSITNGTGAIQSIRIPVIVKTPEIWYRPRLFGTGKVKVHRLIREVTGRDS